MHLPREAIDHVVREALSCRFFPSIAECEEIAGRWKRGDAVLKARAEAKARHERQTRFDELLRRLDRGELDQAAIDTLPERTRLIAEDRGALRRLPDGRHVARQRDAGLNPTLHPQGR